MWALTLRDVMFRRRHFTIAVIGSALLFAIALAFNTADMAQRVMLEVDATSRGPGSQ